MVNEVEYSELSSKEKDSFDIIDIRDEESFNYGHIPGAINIPANEIAGRVETLSKGKELFICCKTGRVSVEVAENLREQGLNAFSLKGGYFAWLRAHVSDANDNERANKVEESLRKKFHKEIFSKFCKAINEYDLIQPNDKIAVCISGGKDSMLMAKLFQELKRHNKFPFEVEFLVMDPGYSKENREIIEKNAQMLNIPITIFETDIFENVFNIEKSPCYICARMRRGHLYNKAKELGCNKIALGHHYDDVIETILMGMLYGAQVQTMMPKLHSTNFEGMELIRPMYLIRESDIKHWRDYNDLHFIQCACKFTDTCTSEGCKLDNTGSKRKKVKQLIEKLKNDDPQIEYNIFKSVENVNLSTVIAYKDEHGEKHNFKEKYNEKNNRQDCF
jgi:tRNA(Ile)-lysidine synthase TilS/MesJ/rhodanese-related sulfurtransferase